jgi:hypothetical protein
MREPSLPMKGLRGSLRLMLSSMSGELAVATVRKNVFAINQEPYWLWTTSVDAPRTDFKKHGQADDMESAKAEVLKNWQLWLDLAALRPR